MNLNNDRFFTACSGVILSPDLFTNERRFYNCCEYCGSQLENQATRCYSCGATSKNSYVVKERKNYYE